MVETLHARLSSWAAAAHGIRAARTRVSPFSVERYGCMRAQNPRVRKQNVRAAHLKLSKLGRAAISCERNKRTGGEAVTRGRANAPSHPPRPGRRAGEDANAHRKSEKIGTKELCCNGVNNCCERTKSDFCTAPAWW